MITSLYNYSTFCFVLFLLLLIQYDHSHEKSGNLKTEVPETIIGGQVEFMSQYTLLQIENHDIIVYNIIIS